MSEPDLYAKIVSELSLPPDVYEILRRPLMDLGFDVISHQDVLERLHRKPVAHYCAQAQGKSVALLHLSKETLSSANAKAFILLLGDSFIEKVAGLFFFTQASDFSDIEYNLKMARQWKNTSPWLCDASFFKYEVIEHVRSLGEAERRQFIGDLLTTNRLLTSAGPPAKPTPAGGGPGGVVGGQMIEQQYVNVLVRIMAKKAASVPNILPAVYMRSIVEGATLPPELKTEMLNLTGSARIDAQNILKAANNRETNAAAENLTPLGGLLQPLLEPNEIDPDDQRVVAGIIYYNRLFLDDAELRALAQRFQIPDRPPDAASVVEARRGPAFELHPPADPMVLQGYFGSRPADMQDVGVMKAALKRTSAVCRVEVTSTRLGTGFLVAPGLVLTNFHVLNLEGQESVQQMTDNALQARLRFGYISAEKGEEAKGQVFRLDREKPILAWSPIGELDFALLRVEEKIKSERDIEPVEFSLDPPPVGTTLNMIQHPEGQVMKIALSGNGVIWKSDDGRLIQYATRAAEGSSGSPCFNEEWNVVAIHHAEETRRFLGMINAGTVREGILFGKIYERIKDFLKTS